MRYANTNDSVGNGYNTALSNYFQRWQMGFGSNLFAHMLCLSNSSEGKSFRNDVQVYLFDMLVHTGGSVAMPSDKGT